MMSMKWGEVGQMAPASQLGWGIQGTEQLRGGSSRERRGGSPGKPEGWRKAQSRPRPDQWPLVFSHMTASLPPTGQRGQAVAGEGRMTPDTPRSHCGHSCEGYDLSEILKAMNS